MRKLKIMEHISLDGVIQTSSTPGDGFPYGDWTAAYRTPAGLQVVNEMYGVTCDVLLGRRTYDILGGYWPTAPKSVMADRLNASRKYVVTHHPETLTWEPCEAVGADVAEGVRRIKESKGPDLIVAGSGSLIATLLEHGLADEVVLLVNPIVLGKGKRFFDGGGLPHPCFGADFIGRAEALPFRKKSRFARRAAFAAVVFIPVCFLASVRVVKGAGECRSFDCAALRSG